jgi:hypothetical protein
MNNQKDQLVFRPKKKSKTILLDQNGNSYKVCNKCKEIVPLDKFNGRRTCPDCIEKERLSKIARCPECGEIVPGHKAKLCNKCILLNFRDVLIWAATIIPIYKKKSTAQYFIKKTYRIIENSIYDHANQDLYSIATLDHPKSTKEEKNYLIEHVFGRNTAAQIILAEIEKIGVENLTTTVLQEMMKKYCFMIYIQFYTEDKVPFHTRVNQELKKFQKGIITFDQYNSVLEKWGYPLLGPELRTKFTI